MSSENLTLAAVVALTAWPFIGLLIFTISNDVGRNIAWTFLLAQLLLPVGAAIKLPMMPPIDKNTTAAFASVLCVAIFRNHRPRTSLKLGLVELLIIANIVTPAITSQLNGDNVLMGPRFLPGVGLYDAVSAAEASLLALVPFLLGRYYLNHFRDLETILLSLAVSSFFYTFLLLFEVRFSPQLHFWVYGYYPTEFGQTLGAGGFRPMAFMGHGLLAAFFLAISLMATTALWKNHTKVLNTSAGLLAGYLVVVLVLCKSLGASVYGLLAAPFILLSKPRTQLRISVILVLIALGYPILRSMDLVPTSSPVGFVKSLSEDRAQSLEFRLENEDQLLARAFEKPFFGWGRYGRSRVYDQYTGKDLSVTDGRWIIDIGQFGIVGFICEFGLLGWSVFRAAASLRYIRSLRDQNLLATLSLIVAINIVDLLPNASLVPWTWLVTGALLGVTERIYAERAASNRTPISLASNKRLKEQESANGRT